MSGFTPTKVTHIEDFKLLMEAISLLEAAYYEEHDPMIRDFLSRPEVKKLRGTV